MKLLRFRVPAWECFIQVNPHRIYAMSENKEDAELTDLHWDHEHIITVSGSFARNSERWEEACSKS